MTALRYPKKIMMKTAITLILSSLILTANGQVADYSKFINDKLINKQQTVKTPEDKEYIVYLGKIKDNKGKILFYIISIYSEVQAAIEIHVHSKVLYLDSNKKFKKEFELETSDKLPFKLENNCLYFHSFNSKTNRKEFYVNHVGTKIPELLCVTPDDCY